MEENLTKKENYSPKETEVEKVKKVADSVKGLARKPGASTEFTSREAFLKKINGEKDPIKRRMLMKALKGRLFQ